MAKCLYCTAPLPGGPNRGSRRRFCCSDHRIAYQTAARRFADALVKAGTVSATDLLTANAPRKACSLVSGAMRQIRVVWAGSEEGRSADSAAA